MQKRLLMRQEGFSLLEVTIAGGVATVLMVGIISIIAQASKEGASIDRKMNQTILINDLRHALVNPLLCPSRLKIRSLTKGMQSEIQLNSTTVAKAGEVIPLFGIGVESLVVDDTGKYAETHFYENKTSPMIPIIEKYRAEGTGLVRWEMNPGDAQDTTSEKGELLRKVEHHYVDLTFKSFYLEAGGKRPFKDVHLARVRWDIDDDIKSGSQKSNCFGADIRAGLSPDAYSPSATLRSLEPTISAGVSTGSFGFLGAAALTDTPNSADAARPNTARFESLVREAENSRNEAMKEWSQRQEKILTQLAEKAGIRMDNAASTQGSNNRDVASTSSSGCHLTLQGAGGVLVTQDLNHGEGIDVSFGTSNKKFNCNNGAFH